MMAENSSCGWRDRNREMMAENSSCGWRDRNREIGTVAVDGEIGTER